MAFIEVIEKKKKEKKKKKKPPKVGNQQQADPAGPSQEHPVNNDELQDEDADGYSSGEEFLKSQMDSASNVTQKETKNQLAWMKEGRAAPPKINWENLPVQNFDDFDPDNFKVKDQADPKEAVDKFDPSNYKDQKEIQEEMEWNQFMDSIDIGEQIALGQSYADAVRQNPGFSKNDTQTVPRKSIDGSALKPLIVKQDEDPFPGWKLKARIISATYGNFVNPQCEWCFMNAPMQVLLDILSENEIYRNNLVMATGQRNDPVLSELLALCAQRGVKMPRQSCKNLLDAINDGRFSKSGKYQKEEIKDNYHDASEFLDALYGREPKMMQGIFGCMQTVPKPKVGIVNLSYLLEHTVAYDILDVEENPDAKYSIMRLIEHEHLGKTKGMIHADQNLYVLPTKLGKFRIYALIFYNIEKTHYIAIVRGKEGWVLYDDLRDSGFKIAFDMSLLNEFVHYIVFERAIESRAW